jgi:hypothetical protein
MMIVNPATALLCNTAPPPAASPNTQAPQRMSPGYGSASLAAAAPSSPIARPTATPGHLPSLSPSITARGRRAGQVGSCGQKLPVLGHADQTAHPSVSPPCRRRSRGRSAGLSDSRRAHSLLLPPGQPGCGGKPQTSSSSRPERTPHAAGTASGTCCSSRAATILRGHAERNSAPHSAAEDLPRCRTHIDHRDRSPWPLLPGSRGAVLPPRPILVVGSGARTKRERAVSSRNTGLCRCVSLSRS